MPPQKKRGPVKTLFLGLLVFVGMAGALIVVPAVALALSSGGGDSETIPATESDPQFSEPLRVVPTPAPATTPPPAPPPAAPSPVASDWLACRKIPSLSNDIQAGVLTDRELRDRV